MHVVNVVIDLYNLNLRQHLMKIRYQFTQIGKCSCVEYLASVFTRENQMILTSVRTVGVDEAIIRRYIENQGKEDYGQAQLEL